MERCGLEILDTFRCLACCVRVRESKPKPVWFVYSNSLKNIIKYDDDDDHQRIIISTRKPGQVELCNALFHIYEVNIKSRIVCPVTVQ